MDDLFIKQGDTFVPYSGPKLVQESDLLAAKGGLEAEIRGLKDSLATKTTEADNTLQRAIRAEQAVETVKTETAPLKEKAAQVDSLTAQLQAATARGTETENRLVGVRRAEIARKFNLAGDKLKELDTLSYDQLNNMEETLTKWGPPPGTSTPPGNTQQQPPNRSFDNGGGGGNQPGSTDLRGRDLIKQGLAAGGN